MGYRYANLHLLHIIVAEFPAVSALPNCVSALSNLLGLIETGGKMFGIGRGLPEIAANSAITICSKWRLAWHKPIFKTGLEHFC